MNKHLLIFGIAILIICIGLSGCNESNETTGATDKVQLVNHIVETYGANSGWEVPVKIGDGFMHNEQSKNGYYKVSGTVKNIAGTMLNMVIISVKFYDSNDNYLHTEQYFINSLPNSYTGDFTVSFHASSSSYYDKAEKVKFEIDTR